MKKKINRKFITYEQIENCSYDILQKEEITTFVQSLTTSTIEKCLILLFAIDDIGQIEQISIHI